MLDTKCHLLFQSISDSTFYQNYLRYNFKCSIFELNYKHLTLTNVDTAILNVLKK